MDMTSNDILPLFPEERLSFEGRIKFVYLKGPVVLFRLVGRTAAGKANNPYGRFWFNGKLFWKVLDHITKYHSEASVINHYLKLILREYTGVCHDWNSFAKVYQMRVPAGQSVNAAVGRIAMQPYFSNKDPLMRKNIRNPLLMAGDFQYIIEVSAEMKKWINGPIPTHLKVGLS